METEPTEESGDPRERLETRLGAIFAPSESAVDGGRARGVAPGEAPAETRQVIEGRSGREPEVTT